MVKIAISEFRAHMSKYLMYVMEGKVVILTSHGKEVAELKQPTSKQESAKAQLEQIAMEAEVGDITTPVIDAFEEQ